MIDIALTVSLSLNIFFIISYLKNRRTINEIVRSTRDLKSFVQFEKERTKTLSEKLEQKFGDDNSHSPEISK